MVASTLIGLSCISFPGCDSIVAWSGRSLCSFESLKVTGPCNLSNRQLFRNVCTRGCIAVGDGTRQEKFPLCGFAYRARCSMVLKQIQRSASLSGRR